MRIFIIFQPISNLGFFFFFWWRFQYFFIILLYVVHTSKDCFLFAFFIWLCKEERKKIRFGKFRWPSSCLDCTCTCMKDKQHGIRGERNLVIREGISAVIGNRCMGIHCVGKNQQNVCLVLMPLEMVFFLEEGFLVFLCKNKERKNKQIRELNKRVMKKKDVRKRTKKV